MTCSSTLFSLSSNCFEIHRQKPRNHRKTSDDSRIHLAESSQGHLASCNHHSSTPQPYTSESPPHLAHTVSICPTIPLCVTMVSQSHNLGRLALDYPVYNSLATPNPQHLPQQRPVRRPSRRGDTGTQSRPRLPPYPRSSSNLADVTDAVATQYSWSRIPLPCPEVPPKPMRGQLPVAMENGQGQGSSTPGVGHEPAARSDAAHGRWTAFDDQIPALPCPPKTPRAKRLRTPDLPELEHVAESSRFCSCCVRKDLGYQEGRAKMDSQREFRTPSRFTLVRVKYDCATLTPV